MGDLNHPDTVKYVGNIESQMYASLSSKMNNLVAVKVTKLEGNNVTLTLELHFESDPPEMNADSVLQRTINDDQLIG